jgi:hypothetical protein
MSEISKARERMMLNKRAQESEMEERHSLPPRKFTINSLTHQIESKFTEMELTPNSNRGLTSARQRVPESPMEARSQPFESRAKENTPMMLKTINVKISGISRMELPSSVRHLDSQQFAE